MIHAILSHVAVIVCMLLYAASTSSTNWVWILAAVGWSFAAYEWGQAHSAQKQLQRMSKRNKGIIALPMADLEPGRIYFIEERVLTDEEAAIERQEADEWTRRMNTDWSQFPLPPDERGEG